MKPKLMEIQNKISKHTIFIACLCFILIGLIFYVQQKASKPEGSAISVLFIGNSLTSVNNLPKMVSDIAASQGDKVNYDMSAPGGYTLYQHTTNTDTQNKIQSGSWNFVVLQEQSQLPAFSDAEVSRQVLPYALELAKQIRQPSTPAKPVLYETWGYKNGDVSNCGYYPTVCNYSLMQNQLSKSYNLMAKKTNGLLAPVGEAWRLLQSTHPEINLYNGDGIHPAAEGSYLAACVFYDIFFNKFSGGATPLNINPSVAKILQQVADKTVFGK
jgi:hypothetical protein